MTETKSPINQYSIEDDFLPLEFLLDYLATTDDTYFESSFSFSPFFSGMKSQLINACANTQNSLSDLFKEYDNVVHDNTHDIKKIRNSEEFNSFVKTMMPSMRLEHAMDYITLPFRTVPLFITEKLNKLIQNGDWELENRKYKIDSSQEYFKQNDIYVLILNRLYGLNIDNSISEIITLRNKKTLLKKHYKVHFSYDFIEIEVNGRLPSLSSEELSLLMTSLDDDQLWQSYFPKDSLKFSGFGIGSWVDVTDVEVLSQMRTRLNHTDIDDGIFKFASEIQTYIRSYFSTTDIEIGLIFLDNRFTESEEGLNVLNLNNYSKSKIDFLLSEEGDSSGIYRKASETKELQVINKLHLNDELSTLETGIANKGFQCLLVYPITNEKNEVVMLIELAAKDKLRFNSINMFKTHKLLDLIKQAYKNQVENYINQINRIVQTNYTAIHPSIQWKFSKVAREYFHARQINSEAELDNIAFDNILPLYGQADIIGSSSLRNEAIREDLIENLNGIKSLLSSWRKNHDFFILDKLYSKNEVLLNEVMNNYNSKDETIVLNFIKDDVNPYILHLSKKISGPELEAYEHYLKILDPTSHTVNRKRKQFEVSVSKVNSSIAKFLNEEEEKLQAIIPHYFEKYKTDGIEYNLYLGQSLLESGDFSKYDVKEFKIWQLTSMCEIVNIVNRLSKDLPIKISTAQMIFVYNHPLSIKFRMDEKKFDVEGTYNVRYEIIKKRIDKATIVGTNERITVENKVAIIYLNDSDKEEYLDYISHLQEIGLIEDDVEDLELNNLQGVTGLKALRIAVKTTN